jgi:hypothetical protein
MAECNVRISIGPPINNTFGVFQLNVEVSVSTSASYSAGPGFTTRSTAIYIFNENFCGFSQSTQTNVRIVEPNRPRPFPFTT